MSGWNGSGSVGGGAPAARSRSGRGRYGHAHFRGALAGASVVVLAAAAYFAIFGTGSDEVSAGNPSARTRGAIAEASPASHGRRQPAPEPARPVDAPSVAASSAAAGEVQPPSAAQPDAAPAEDAAGKRLRPRQAFSNSTDQLIAMATGGPPDVSIPPLPVMSDADTDRFIESLGKPLEILEDDTPAVRRTKEHVQKIRMEIASLMKENPGVSLSEILNEHRNAANYNTECRSEVMSAVGELLAAGDVEGARKLRDTMNLALQQIGVPEVDIPVTEEEHAAQGGETEQEGE